MDVPVNQILEAPLIKVEVLEIKEEPNINHEEHFEVYKHEDIKKEEPDTELQIPKHENDSSEEIRNEELNSDIDEDHHINREQQQHSSTEQQNETSKKKPFKCTYEGCHKYYRFKTSIRTHINTFHRGIIKEKSFKCQYPDCGRTYRDNDLLKSHVHTEHKGEKPFSCDYQNCKMTFIEKTRLKTQRVAHSDLKLVKCSVEGCKKAFKSKNHLTSHLRFHRNDRPFICPNEACQKTFKLKYSLEYHQQWYCVGSETNGVFVCGSPHCGKRFQTKSLCRNHMRTHEAVKPVRCLVGQCDADFRKNSELKVHMRTHSEDKIFHCTFEGCGLYFWKRAKLFEHLDTHVPRLSLCPHENCSESFENHELLRVHLRSHLHDNGTADGKDGSSKEDLGIARKVKTYVKKQYVRNVKACDKSRSANDISLT